MHTGNHHLPGQAATGLSMYKTMNDLQSSRDFGGCFRTCATLGRTLVSSPTTRDSGELYLGPSSSLAALVQQNSSCQHSLRMIDYQAAADSG